MKNLLATTAIAFALVSLGSAEAHHVPGHHKHVRAVTPNTGATVTPRGVVVRAPVGSDVDVDVDGNDVEIDVVPRDRGVLGLGLGPL